jgi:hypothetical protein
MMGGGTVFRPFLAVATTTLGGLYRLVLQVGRLVGGGVSHYCVCRLEFRCPAFLWSFRRDSSCGAQAVSLQCRYE